MVLLLCVHYVLHRKGVNINLKQDTNCQEMPYRTFVTYYYYIRVWCMVITTHFLCTRKDVQRYVTYYCVFIKCVHGYMYVTCSCTFPINFTYVQGLLITKKKTLMYASYHQVWRLCITYDIKKLKQWFKITLHTGGAIWYYTG